MRIGIYGGTFDPPHLGHHRAAIAAATELELDLLLLIPAKLPPHKDLPQETAAPEHRLAMTQLMADSLPIPVEVLDMELHRGGPSYTVHTLEELRARYPHDQLWLLMGSDMFLSLETWYEAERVMKLASIGAFCRTFDHSAQEMEQFQAHLTAQYGATVRLVTIPDMLELSSTQVRESLCHNGGYGDLWCQIHGYILRHKLYGTCAHLAHLSDDQLRVISLSMVRAKRVAHILGAEQEAVKLARHWGEDEDSARRGAILHDCTKYLTLAEHLAICDQYQVPLDDLERIAVKLLHSKTGAALAEHVFGQSPAVCDAIRYHTTGRGGMSTLEKILYIADYMEPNRKFDGVEQLRHLAYTDLDGAMILGLRMTVEDMAERNVPVHANTLAALQDLEGTHDEQ